MFRSSTSNSDPSPRWRKVVLIALVVVVAAELFLRLPVVESAIGPPDIYYSPGVQERLNALESVRATYGEVDLIFVGSSVTRTNLSPLIFDDELAAEGHEVVSFNGGLSALRIDPARLFLEERWLHAAHPSVLVQAVRYEDVAHAEPVQEFEPFGGGKYERLWLSDSPLARAQEAILDRSRLIQYAGFLSGVLVRPDSALVPDGFSIDERGFNATQRNLADVRLYLGYDEIPGGEAAERGYEDPLDPAIFNSGLEMLAETIALARRDETGYVLVNMPEHGEKFLAHKDGQHRYDLYVETLRAFAVEQGIPFVDLAAGDLHAYQDDSLFADFNHMTPEAAAVLTRQLAMAFMTDPDLVSLWAS